MQLTTEQLKWVTQFEEEMRGSPLPAGFARHAVDLYVSGKLTMENIRRWKEMPAPDLVRTDGTMTCINGEEALEFAKTIPEAPTAEVVLKEDPSEELEVIEVA